MKLPVLERDADCLQTARDDLLNRDDLLRALGEPQPQDARRAARWKDTQATDRDLERAHVDGRVECRYQALGWRIRHERERQMRLLWIDELHIFHGGECGVALLAPNHLADRVIQVDGHEHPHRVTSRTASTGSC